MITMTEHLDQFLTVLAVNSTGQDLEVWRGSGDMYGQPNGGEHLTLKRRGDVLASKWEAVGFHDTRVAVEAVDRLLELAQIEKLPPAPSQLDRIESKLDELLSRGNP